MITRRGVASSKPFVLGLFILSGLLAYSNIINAFFLSDDFAQIGQVRQGDLSFIWGLGHGGFFRPLLILSYFVDGKLWGLAPFGYHLTNLLLHGANAFLVYLLSLRLTGHTSCHANLQKRIAFASGLIFLVHPSHTEAVSWISGRADLLATVFCLLSLLAYISFARGGRGGAVMLLSSLVSFALALLSKEAAICLPFVVIVVGIYPGERGGSFDPVRRNLISRNLKVASLFFLLLGLYLALRAWMLGLLVGGYGAAQHLNFTHSVVISQLLRFTMRTLFPAVVLRSLTFLESRALSPILIVTGSVVALVTIIMLARAHTRRAVCARARRNSFLWWLLVLFVCGLLPVINLRINVFDTMGERFLYFPSVFSSLALAYLAVRLVRHPKLSLAIIFCVMGFYLLTLRATNRHWNEASQISQHVLADITAHARHDTVVLLNLPDNLRGVHLFRNGIEQALSSFQTEKEIKHTHALAFHPIQSAHDEAQLSEATDSFTLRLVNRETAFERVNDPPASVELSGVEPQALHFRLQPEAGSAVDVFYFSAGRMWEVTKGGN